MPAMTISLPVLPADRPMRLSPTDISKFVRHEQCERFLRLQLTDRAGQRFMEDYGVVPQRIPPLRSQSGGDFEQLVEAKIREALPAINFATTSVSGRTRTSNNGEVAEAARALRPGKTVVLFQPRLDVEVAGWLLRGDVDLIRFDRMPSGELVGLIVDMKSTTAVKIEHRLQTAFYRVMLEKLFVDASIPHGEFRLGILYRQIADPSDEVVAEAAPRREAARQLFGLTDALLELVDDPDAYVRSAQDLVFGPESIARRVAAANFADLPYALSFKCDECTFNEFCMKWSAETQDLALLPFLTVTDRDALRRAGVQTIAELAGLKTLTPAAPGDKAKSLAPARGREEIVKRIGSTWSVGPRLDELIHRAKRFLKLPETRGSQTLNYIPNSGNSTLPVCRPDLNPNLVWVYLDAQRDYLEGRVYLLGALVVANCNGAECGRRSVVKLTDGPPETAASERILLLDFTRELLRAVVELASPANPNDATKAAPIHIVFFDHFEQKVLLDALARHYPPILQHSPPLYDFLTQLAAFDSPIATFLDEEIKAFKNYPLTCQNLQSLAKFLRFDWSQPHRFREAFKVGMFDYVGKLGVGDNADWYTRRCRFGSTIPLEYAYAAWGRLPTPPKDQPDLFKHYRPVTPKLLAAFQTRRLEAIEHVTRDLRGNDKTQKTAFTLPDLARFTEVADTLAQALDEFVQIERLTELSDWKETRHIPPERRVLMGDCLLVSYREDDQDQEMVERNRENLRRQRLYEQHREAQRAANTDANPTLVKEQKKETEWSPAGLQFRLRVEVEGLDCDLPEALLMSNLKTGDELIVFPRLTVDKRLPPQERKPFTPTPKQMLYGQRATLKAIRVTERDSAGRPAAAVAEVELKESRGNSSTRPFVFSSNKCAFVPGERYTLDVSPDSWYGYWQSVAVKGLCRGEPNVLYDRLIDPPDHGDGAGLPGQARFLKGLEAYHRAGLLHDFEPGKRQFIGGHGRTPMLLVQGPPGTGKSYTTAFAVFARLQAAMADGRPYRVFLTCKTHAATEVLLENVLKVQLILREFRKKSATLFDKYFDRQLLDVPLFRVAPKSPVPNGVLELRKEQDKDRDEDKNADIIGDEQWVVVAVTPGGIYRTLKDKWGKKIFGHKLCDLLVLDESSQMNLPEALLAALPLAKDAPVVVVGDHRQMPPIVKHHWETEARRTFHRYAAYESLFDTLRLQNPPMIQFAESFRLHAAMAEYLRREVYRHDGIPFHSKRLGLLRTLEHEDGFVSAVLRPEYPLVVVTHEESGSQVRNPFEQALIEPVLRTLADPELYGLDAKDGLGVVVPHRAQRAALIEAFPELADLDPVTGLPARPAIDTVERFQGGEREVILVSATESDRAYLLAASGFLLDPRRLTVAVSRAKRKMILFAARNIFALFSPDEETFANALLWKNLLAQTCTECLWEGMRNGHRVRVWGGACENEGPANVQVHRPK